MNHCDYHEEQLSAWLDDELDRADQVELTDHLVRCAACRRYYAGARALDGVVALARDPRPGEAPSPELWQRIEQAAARAPARRGAGIPAWALQAAAALVVAVGLSLLAWSNMTQVAEPPADAMVRIGQDPGSMTDERFVELTRELLRAEPRYRNAMYRVMDQVIRDTEILEASTDYDISGRAPREDRSTELAERPPV